MANENTTTTNIFEGIEEISLDPASLTIPYSRDDVKEEPTPEVVEEPEAPVATPEPEVEYVADPGDYVPQDYSFEVTVYDDKGEHPKVQKISSVEDWEQLLETDPNLGSSAALFKAQRLAAKIELTSDRDKAEWQKKKDDYDSVAKSEQAETEQQQTWINEIQYLIDRGDLPKVTKTQAAADWSDPDVAKQDGVKEQVALLKFMRTENTSRAKAGLKQLTSMIDAYNAMQQDGRRKGTTTTAPVKGKASQKAAGGKVATGSATATPQVPAGYSVGRGGSLDDIGRGMF